MATRTKPPGKEGRWIETYSAAETHQWGLKMGKILKRGAALMLIGKVGCGKTTFVRGLAEGLGIRVDSTEVVSPTFVLIHEYPCRIPLYHVDLYRLKSLNSDDAALISEYLDAGGITAIEWADHARRLFPENYLQINFKHGGGDKRKLRWKTVGLFKWSSS